MEGPGFIAFICWVLFGYLLGSCPTGYVIVKLLIGEDIRNFGSGNIGATNVSRVLGKKWAVVTAVADMLKGGVAVLIAMIAGVNDTTLLALIGFAGVVGHDFPVWLGFKGGKGVATTFGVFGCFDFFNPLPAIFGGIAWFLVREATGYVSVASMISLAIAALFMPIFSMPTPYYVVAILLVLLTVRRHKENIRRLLAGTESKVSRILFK